MADVVAGLDVLLAEAGTMLAGQRVGLVANHSCLTRDLESGVDALHNHPGVRLVALFGPEHGLRGAAQAGQHVATATDARTGLPVYSLYGQQQAPTPETLAGLDTLLFDVQDAGARYFTYASTLRLTLRAAAENGVRLVVLDRPNPLGGQTVDGDVLDPAYASFVGGHPVAIRHGLTLGELALLINARENLEADLRVVTMRGWRREMWYDDTGLPWTPPSSNLPTLNSATLYPGTCLLEGVNVSEGRGTTQPFELCGAPWIDGERLRALLRERLPREALPRACSFVPAFSKYAGQLCSGVALHLSDRPRLHAVAVGVHLLFALRDLYPRQFAVLAAPDGGRPFLDLLAGAATLREALAEGAAARDVLEQWDEQALSFAAGRAPYLLYE